MKIGSLDRVVELRRDVPTGAVDALNVPVKVDTLVATFRAEKIHKSEDERFAAEQRYAVRAVTFRAWFRADVIETDRLVCEGVTYDIRGVREIGRREGIEISCEAHP